MSTARCELRQFVEPDLEKAEGLRVTTGRQPSILRVNSPRILLKNCFTQEQTGRQKSGEPERIRFAASTPGMPVRAPGSLSVERTTSSRRPHPDRYPESRACPVRAPSIGTRDRAVHIYPRLSFPRETFIDFGYTMPHSNRFGSVSISTTTGLSIRTARRTASGRSCGRATRIPAPPQASA